jgi:uncharacterized membrane protein
VALLLSFVISFTISFAVNLVSAAVGVASSVAVQGPRGHRVPDPTAVPFMMGFGILGIVLHLVSAVVNIAASSFFAAGIAKFGLKVAKGEPYAFGDVFAGGGIFLSVLVAQFITSIAVGLGLVLLIVPGVILGIGFSMALPLIADRNLGPIDAIGESWKLTEGNRVNIFIFALIAIGLSIAGVCACGLGIFLVWPLLTVAWFYAYLRLSGQPVAQVARAA